MFAFTSMGGQIDNTINDGRGPYVFRLHGQNYHLIRGSETIDPSTIADLQQMLDRNNPLVHCFRMARDHFKDQPMADLQLRLSNGRQKYGRQYNVPTASEVAALVVGDCRF